MSRRKGRFNAALHPRDALGRFAPKYVPGSAQKHVRLGKEAGFYRVRAGAEFDLRQGRGGRAYVEGAVGYRPSKKNTGRKVAK